MLVILEMLKNTFNDNQNVYILLIVFDFFCLIVSFSCNLSHFHLGCHKRFIGEREFEEWTNDSKASLGEGVIIIT